MNCKSCFKSSTLTDHLSIISSEEVDTAMKHILDEEETSNATLKKLFTSVRGQSSSISDSNEGASFARQKMFSLWHYFGAPAVFLQLPPVMNAAFVSDYMQHQKNIHFQVLNRFKIRITVY